VLYYAVRFMIANYHCLTMTSRCIEYIHCFPKNQSTFLVLLITVKN